MSNPIIAITEACSGIGEATANAFSTAEHPLLFSARMLDRMQALLLSKRLCIAIDAGNGDSSIANMIGLTHQIPQIARTREMVMALNWQEI